MDQRVRLQPNDKCWCGSGAKYKKCHKGADETTARESSALTQAGRIKPGIVSPRRSVPESIVAPDYARTGRPTPPTTSDVKTGERLVRFREACRTAAQVLAAAGKRVKAGVTTDALDAFVHEECLRRGVYPSPLNYRGFPKSLCTSVNEVICHGIPDSRSLDDGDIVNLDITVFQNGMHGDTNATFLVGDVDERSRKLVTVTRECLMKGIEAAKPGNRVNDIGRAIQTHAEANGFSVLREYCGHGVGETFHTQLQIPHYFDPAADLLLEPGMTFTIEPMINAGKPGCRHWDDGWTAVTLDGARSAQFEHSILVTDTGAEILTLP